MAETRVNRFCIVGPGGHALTKLIPAIEANGQQVVGLVSSRPAETFPGRPVFARLEEAIDALPADTAFVVASPPAAHFDQAATVLTAGRDLFLEKPAFVTEGEAQAIADLCRGETVFVEAFMHRYTRLHARAVDAYSADRGRIATIGMDFLIPQMPGGTFRQRPEIDASSLYDMGCYPLSLLADFDLPLDGLALDGVECAGDPFHEQVRLSGEADGIRVELRIGVADSYANRLRLEMTDGATIGFEPFFYGRPGDRTITTTGAGQNAAEIVTEDNAFEAMFARPREAWLTDQDDRLNRTIRITRTLERLGRDLAVARVSDKTP